MFLIKTFLIITFICVFYQDYKDRQVYWFFYPLIGILSFFLHLKALNNTWIVLTNIVFNLTFIVFLIIVCVAYSHIRLNKKFREVIGIGDVLFFIFISFSFSLISFIILFTFSLFFSLIMHFFLSKKQHEKSVPLAGYMSFFFAAVYGISSIAEYNFLYTF